MGGHAATRSALRGGRGMAEMITNGTWSMGCEFAQQRRKRGQHGFDSQRLPPVFHPYVAGAHHTAKSERQRRQLILGATEIFTPLDEDIHTSSSSETTSEEYAAAPSGSTCASTFSRARGRSPAAEAVEYAVDPRVDE